MSASPSDLVPLPKPNLQETSEFFKTAESGRAEDVREDLRQKALSSLYFFTKVVLGFNALSPRFHFDRCEEIQNGIPDKKFGSLWPRGHFKSTIITKSYPLWRLAGGGWELAHPDKPKFDYSIPSLDPRCQRVFAAGESDTRVVAALRNIKWHVTSNTMFKWLFLDLVPPDINKTLWRDDAIVLPRAQEFDEPSIRVVGVGTKVTGYHGDIFLFDDLIGEAASKSEAVMQAANDWFDYAYGLANDPENVEWLFAGTRWKFGQADLYGRLMEEQPFWRDAEGKPHGIKWFVHSAIGEDGQPVFPERFSLKTLQDINKQLKDYKYSCQYLNVPNVPEGGDFPATLAGTFYGEGTTLTPNDGTPPCDINILHRIAFYDLSSGGVSAACENAIVILGIHPDGRRFVLDAFLKNCGYREALENYYRLNDQYICSRNYYENIGAQKEIEELDAMQRANDCELCRKRKEANPDLEIKPHRNLRLQGYDHKGFSGNKDDRIRLYLQGIWEEGKMYFNVKLRALMNQVTGFPNFHLKDGTDALASAVHLGRVPAGEDEQRSAQIEEEQRKEQAPEPRVYSERCYGGY